MTQDSGLSQQQIKEIAVTTLQTVAGMGQAAFDKMVGEGKYELVVMVSAADEVFWMSNIDRVTLRRMLEYVLVKKFDSKVQAAAAPGASQFERLLNECIRCALKYHPGSQKARDARADLERYHASLFAQPAAAPAMAANAIDIGDPTKIV